MENNKFHSAQHLSYEELIGYSQGNLSNSEMHRLELHLISCELCNDALDGIATLRDKDQARKSIEKIKDLSMERTALNVEAQNAQSEKDKDKIEKKIDKIDKNKVNNKFH